MSFSKIKSSLHIAGVIMYTLVSPVIAFSQVDLNPDTIFHGTSEMPWFPNGTNVISAQGSIFVITYKQNYPDTRAYGVYVYTIDKNGNQAPYKMGKNQFNYFYYGFPLEGTYYQGIQGNSIAFIFNGQLWHYINQLEDGSLLFPAKDSYDCFAMVPIPNTGEPRTYYDFISGAPTVIKKGAFQHDSTLFFLGVYAQKNDPNYQKWCLQKYTYNKVQNKFSYNSTIPMLNIAGDSFGGFVEHIDSTDRHRLIIDTYQQNSYYNSLGYLDASASGNQTTFSYTLFAVNPGIVPYASTIIGGSIKGCRTPDQVFHKEFPERFSLIGIGTNNTMWYSEFIFLDDMAVFADAGMIVLPSTMAPYPVMKDYNIQGTFELIPAMFHTNVNESPDGFRQQNWVYYPDKNEKICGARFLSDSWQYLPDSTVFSDDLDRDSIYGPEVRSLWTLIGIVDGAPPCAINWHVWDSVHAATLAKPTFLKFTKTSVSVTEVTTTHEDQYTIGVNLKTDNKKYNFGLETKFSDSFKNSVSNSTTIKKEITKTFELSEEGQEIGRYIYSVPSIIRYMYQVYPWWDNSLTNPVPNTVQYRYVVNGTALLDRHRDLNEFPFYVDEPNSYDLADWTSAGRTFHTEAITDSGLEEACTPAWASPDPGDIGSFENISDSISEYEHKSSFTINASFSGKKPEVFTASSKAGYEVAYSTSTKTKTEMGTKLEVNLETLKEKSAGIRISNLTVHTYWFRPEDYDWWFYDSLGTEHPWYIAYIVSGVQGEVTLTSPSNDEIAAGEGKLFSWQASGFTPKEFSLFFSSSPHVTPSSTIRRINAGTSTDYYVSELAFDVEKLYWAVRAVTAEGDFIWSESRPLVLGKEEMPGDRVQELTAIPYPNPGNGSGLNLIIDTREKGGMLVRLYGADGSMVYQSVIDHPAEGPQTYVLPVRNLSQGLYILEVSINGERAIKKVTVL